MVTVELDIGPITDTIYPEEEIVGVTLKDTELGLKRSINLPYSMLEKVLMMLEKWI